LTDLGSRRKAFDAHVARLRISPKITLRAITCKGYARAASDTAGSLRVLKKAGFQAVGTECSFAPARKTEIEETILRKD